MEKHLFAGAITMEGFQNLYGNILNREKAKNFFVIKGGSGVGKSSLLKRIAKYYSKIYSIEYYHCSGDIDSLDGIYISDIETALIDGTSPHIVDPKYVKCNDYEIDLACCIDDSNISKVKDNILCLMKRKEKMYKSIFSLTNILGQIYLENLNIFKDSFDENYIILKAKNALDKIEPQENFKKRTLFNRAITANGITSLRCEYEENVVFINAPIYLANLFIDKIKKFAEINNYNYSLYLSPYSINIYEGIVVENTIFTTNPCAISQNYSIVDLIVEDVKYLSKEQEMFENLIVSKLNEVKKVHLDIEKRYSPLVNFNKIDFIFDDIIRRINSSI